MGRMIDIDITGNWQAEGGHVPAVQVHEPALAEGHAQSFQQELQGIDGGAVVRFAYPSSLHEAYGYPLTAAPGAGPSGHLVVDRDLLPLHWEAGAAGDDSYVATVQLPARAAGDTVSLRFVWACTRPPRTTLVTAAADAADSIFRALTPRPAGVLMMAHGIPFRTPAVRYSPTTPYRQAIELDQGSLGVWDGSELDANGVAADAIHFLGMTHLFDKGNGSWYTPKGDHGWSHFVGDHAGEIVLHWVDGGATTIPLIFGFNLWYSRPWDIMWHYDLWDGPLRNYDADLFGGDAECRQRIRDGLALVDGIRPLGPVSSNARFIFSVHGGGRPLRAVSFHGTPEMHLHPLISAVTIETHPSDTTLPALPALAREPARTRPMSLDNIARHAYRPGVEGIKRVFYTFRRDLPALGSPAVPRGYVGPAYDFGPTPEAIYAATFLYRNGPECASHIADCGMEPASPVSSGALAHYQLGCGVWRATAPFFGSLENWFDLYRGTTPGHLGGLGSAWSRGIGELLREAMAFGYDKFVDSYIDWLDGCLLTEATPPHWNRTPGNPEYCTYRTRVGDVEERGVRENDGHGICMWGRYMVYHWMGRPAAWAERRFAATAASVDWIRWQLDTDTLRPGVRKDVLYTESECAHDGYDIYSSYNCLHGLKLAIRMAGQLGRDELVDAWTLLYHRLRRGILDHLVDQTEVGPVWHTAPDCDWQDHAHKLVHLHLATEGDTFTPLQDYARGDAVEREYLAISRTSYRYLMRATDYDCLRMYGYGQGVMAQAALLLDEMGDATRFLEELLRHAYLPHLSGWACPEGIIAHRSGEYYLPVNGYMGQDSHVADATKALRLMLGVDDNDPTHLRLVPRFPAAWTALSIERFPVLTGDQRQHVAYEYRRERESQRFTCRFERDPGRWALRLGPFEPEQEIGRASLNGQAVVARRERSGDSDWAWIDVDEGPMCQVEVALTAR